MDALFSYDFDELHDQNQAKKAFILITRFWTRKSRLQKTAKTQEIEKDKAVNTSIFGCEIDEQCSKSYKKYTRNQELLPLSRTTEKKCCKTQHFRPQQVQKIRGLGVAPGGQGYYYYYYYSCCYYYYYYYYDYYYLAAPDLGNRAFFKAV